MSCSKAPKVLLALAVLAKTGGGKSHHEITAFIWKSIPNSKHKIEKKLTTRQNFHQKVDLLQSKQHT
jgi:hypothetical protein